MQDALCEATQHNIHCSYRSEQQVCFSNSGFWSVRYAGNVVITLPACYLLWSSPLQLACLEKFILAGVSDKRRVALALWVRGSFILYLWQGEHRQWKQYLWQLPYWSARVIVLPGKSRERNPPGFFFFFKVQTGLNQDIPASRHRQLLSTRFNVLLVLVIKCLIKAFPALL